MLWRSTVFLITLLLIYLAFPVLIVPSSLPAIQQMFVANEYPEEFFPQPGTVSARGTETDLEIYELSIPKIPTLKDKVKFLKNLHKQGMDLIFPQPLNLP